MLSIFLCLHIFYNLENNNNMNYFWWTILTIILFLLLIVFMPINLKAKVSYNVLKNKGKINLKLFKLDIFTATLLVQTGFLELKLKNGKTLLTSLVIRNTKQLKETDFVLLILQKIYIQQGVMYINFGLQDDALLTAMSMGVVKMFTSILGTIVKSKKVESKIKNKIYPSFNKDKFIVCLKASIKISPYKILLSFMQSKIRKIKNNKEIMQYE